MSRERSTTELAHAGDVIGIHNHGGIGIGDTFTQGEKINFQGIPTLLLNFLEGHNSKTLLKRRLFKRA